MSQPLIRNDSYWSDVWNIMLLRPVYRKPASKAPKHEDEKPGTETQPPVEPSTTDPLPATELVSSESASNESSEPENVPNGWHAPGAVSNASEQYAVANVSLREAIDFGGLGGALWTIAEAKSDPRLTPMEQKQVEIGITQAMMKSIWESKGTQQIDMTALHEHLDTATRALAEHPRTSDAVRQVVESSFDSLQVAMTQAGFYSISSGLEDEPYDTHPVEGKRVSTGDKFEPYYPNGERQPLKPLANRTLTERRSAHIYEKDIQLIEKISGLIRDKASNPPGWQEPEPRAPLLNTQLSLEEITPDLLKRLGYTDLDAAIASGYLNNSAVADVAGSVGTTRTRVKERIPHLLAELKVEDRLGLYYSIMKSYLQYLSQDIRYLLDAYENASRSPQGSSQSRGLIT